LSRSICTKRGCTTPQSRFGLCSKHDYAKNRDWHRSRQKRMYPKYKKKILIREKKRYDEKRDEILKRQKDKREANPRAARKYDNAYYQKNKIHLANEEKKRYNKDRDSRCERERKRWNTNDKFRKKTSKQIKKYQQMNPEVQRRSWEKRYARESYAFEVTSDAYRYMIMAWKGVLMKRDTYCCVYCGAKGKKSKLEAHHIIYKRTQIKLALIENNGCILCRKCHHSVHKLNPIKYGRRKKL
jgi:5-methylcytosine-specific restriction endonuclease McrA